MVLGEGRSEEIVLPRLAEAMGIPIDRSFVAVVPLGGRHVNHLWRLLSALEIPHATLLDLDYGRIGGGWHRVKTACEQLLATGVKAEELFGPDESPEVQLRALGDGAPDDLPGIRAWVKRLRTFGIFFCDPLDLDLAMLQAFFNDYTALDGETKGPYSANPRPAIFGDKVGAPFYTAEFDEALRWYRYLFLNRGKPTTHVRVLSQITTEKLAMDAPEVLRALVTYIAAQLKLSPDKS